LETESDDRFDAAEVLPKHDPRSGKHSVGQGVERTSRQKQLTEGLVFQVVVAELENSSLLDEGSSWANLSIVADDQQLPAAHQCRQRFDA